jgi:Kef-type K+ transport system membrane component KefB
MNQLREQIAQIVVSILIVCGFVATVCMILTHAMPTGNEGVAHELLGALSSMATMVASYWMGSSAGGARKDRMLADAQAALAVSTPPSGGVQPTQN